MDTGASAKLELLDKFCYLRDMLSVDGDADAAVEARIRIGWNKFRQLVPLLTNKDVSLIMRGRLYSRYQKKHSPTHNHAGFSQTIRSALSQRGLLDPIKPAYNQSQPGGRLKLTASAFNRLWISMPAVLVTVPTVTQNLLHP